MGGAVRAAPAIAPGCTLLVRPIFSETKSEPFEAGPKATPVELAVAIIEPIRAGARVLNLSVALASPSMQSDASLDSAFDFAASRGVICVAAAGNQALVGSSAITRHPWVLPVGACASAGPSNGALQFGTLHRPMGIARSRGGCDSAWVVDARSRAFGGTKRRPLLSSPEPSPRCGPNFQVPRRPRSETPSPNQEDREALLIVPPLLNAWLKRIRRWQQRALPGGWNEGEERKPE